ASPANGQPAPTQSQPESAATPQAESVDGAAAADGNSSAPAADTAAGHADAPANDDAAQGFPQTASPEQGPLPSPVLTITFGDDSHFAVEHDVTNVGRADVAQNWHPELDVIPFGGGAPDLGVSRHQAV